MESGCTERERGKKSRGKEKGDGCFILQARAVVRKIHFYPFGVYRTPGKFLFFANISVNFYTLTFKFKNLVYVNKKKLRFFPQLFF